GSGPNMGNSTSPAVSFVNNPPEPQPPVVALAVSPATADTVTTVTLTATVSVASGTPTGAVTFRDSATTLGTAPLTADTASFTSTFAAGNHSFTASFSPADPTAFLPATSTSLPYVVTPFTGSTASETLTTTVAAGVLTISVANTNPVVLPTPVL